MNPSIHFHVIIKYYGTSQAELETKNNNIILSGTAAHANTLSNGTPILANATTTDNKNIINNYIKILVYIKHIAASTYVPPMVSIIKNLLQN